MYQICDSFVKQSFKKVQKTDFKNSQLNLSHRYQIVKILAKSLTSKYCKIKHISTMVKIAELKCITQPNKYPAFIPGTAMSMSAPYWVRMAPNGTNLGPFQFQYILSRRAKIAKMYWNWKSPRFVPFGAILTQFEAKPNGTWYKRFRRDIMVDSQWIQIWIFKYI